MIKKYDFDQGRITQNWTSMKWNRYSGREVLAMWVADMDFDNADEIITDLKKLLDNGRMAYSEIPDEAYETVMRRYRERTGWEVEKEHILFIPCLVTGLNVVCRAAKMLGCGEVATFSPVYYHFHKAPISQGVANLPIPMKRDERGWSMDLDALERSITPKTKLLQLCNPQNPVGRVFTAAELESLGEICEKRGLFVMSDEVHMDLILDPEKKHVPFPKACPRLAERTVVLNSAGKAFNIADAKCAYLIVPPGALREAVEKAVEGIVSRPNALGLQAMISAYSKAGNWLDQVVDYLRRNRDYLIRRLGQMPFLDEPHPQEATYLYWVGAKKLPPRFAKYLEAHGLGFSDGEPFGDPRSFRINFACPFPRLELAMNRLEIALEHYRAETANSEKESGL